MKRWANRLMAVFGGVFGIGRKVRRARVDPRARARAAHRPVVYASGGRLRPYQVRNAIFESSRRGLDPDQVYPFLRHIADEMDQLYRDLAAARADADRVKQGLRRWQSWHVNCRHPNRQPATAPFGGNRGPW
jgi:DivIVA domain-containing protein